MTEPPVPVLPRWRGKAGPLSLVAGRGREKQLLEDVLPTRHPGVPSPAVVLVEGFAGFGRTTLLRWAAAAAEERGARVLTARCSTTESGFPYGVVAQLLAPLTRLAPEVTTLLRSPADAPRPMNWPCRELLVEAARHPLLLVVDDAQWADDPSLTLLARLFRQLRDVPVTVLVSATPSVGPRSLSQRLGLDVVHRGRDSADHPSRTDHLLRLGPLSSEAVAEVLVAHGWPAPVDPAPAAEVTRRCRGNPAVLVAALASWGEEASEGVGAATALGPHLAAALTRWAARMVEGLPDEARALLRSCALAAGELDTRQLIRLAGLGVPVGTRALALLTGMGLVGTGDRPSPVCPEVAGQALGELTATEREELHARAADICYQGGVRDSLVAEMLLAAPSFRPPWAVEVLRTGATERRLTGPTRSLMRSMENALARTADLEERIGLHIELGLAARSTDPVVCQRHFDMAYELCGTDPALALCRLRAADQLTLLQGPDALSDAVVGHPSRGVPPRHGHPWCGPSDPGTDGLPPGAAVDALPDAARAGLRAWRLAVSGAERDRVVELARHGLRDTTSPAGVTLYTPTLAAASALLLTGDEHGARDVVLGVGALIDESLYVGESAAALHGLLLRAWGYHLLGLPEQTVTDLRAAAELGSTMACHPRLMPLVVAVRSTVLRLDGLLPAAEQALSVDPVGAGEGGLSTSFFLYARAEVRAADGRPREALADFVRCGQGLTGHGWNNPVLLPWRARAAALAGTLNDHAFAVALSSETHRLELLWAPSTASAPYGDRSSGTVPLTPAETRVATLAGEGLSNRLVAERLSISPRTVELHLTRAYRKLGISGRAELPVALALPRRENEGDDRVA
ncbi:helix-turn-helix transcriptional regulator [Streptomyces sp. MA5143a]|uniref:helix-turn-helix transcriptional regulator n=1 Tax=Streptomyces sp. MA5143a TaxID=2083010 RepID=UPI000D2EB452|nr:LuxR family transcriptional regulator [Streptomyces sp. MA5143a]SPF07034.1 transcriptional regulator MalT [Streptomyces sp. MA5143a]